MTCSPHAPCHDHAMHTAARSAVLSTAMLPPSRARGTSDKKRYLRSLPALGACAATHSQHRSYKRLGAKESENFKTS